MKKSLKVEVLKDGKKAFCIELPATQEEFSEILAGENINEYKIGSIEYTGEFDNGFHCNLWNRYGGIDDLNKINVIAYYLSNVTNYETLQAMLTEESAERSSNLDDWIEYAEEIQNFDYIELPNLYGNSNDGDEENDKEIVSWYCNREGIDISDDFIESSINYKKMASDIIVDGVHDCFATDKAFIYRAETQTEPKPLEIPDNLKLV